MAVVTMRQLLESGVHFGHQTRRWNPKMKRFMGWSKGLLAPNNETVVNAFARLAEQRLEDLRQDD